MRALTIGISGLAVALSFAGVCASVEYHNLTGAFINGLFLGFNIWMLLSNLRYQ